MTWPRPIAWLALVAMVGAATMGLPAPTAFAAQSDLTQNAPGQVLVMIRMAPPHRRPGGTYGADYGGTGDQVVRRRLAKGIAARYRLDLKASWPMPLLGVDCFVMTLPAGTTTSAAIEALSHDAEVAWAQPLQAFSGLAAGDPLLDAQPAQMQWRLGDLHKLATGRGVSVAVIDSRIDTGHPDLIGQFSVVRDFVTPRAAAPGPPERHGTEVAGIIAAREGNGMGLVGMAPESRLMALRACWQSGTSPATSCNSFTLGQALEFAIEQGAKIINLSLSGPPDPLLAKLVNIALQRKIAVVASIDPRNPAGSFPASIAGVISVTDAFRSGTLAGAYVAPGHDIPTTVPGGGWALVNGSSFSAAHLSGLLALVRQRSVGGAPALARDGQGQINACVTLARLAAGYRCGADNRLALIARGH